MRKKIYLGVFIVLILAITLSGCGGSNTPDPTSTPISTPTPTSPHHHEFTADTDTVALWHFNENSGTTVADSSISGSFPLTLMSYLSSPVLPSLVPSGNEGFGNCLSLDGTKKQNAAYAPLGGPWINSFSGHKISVELWCKFTSISSTSMLFSGNDVDFKVYITSEGKIQLLIGDGIDWQLNTISNTGLTADTWHYVACTYDKASNLAAIYIDGNPDKSESPSVACDINLLRASWIGSNPFGSGAFFTGFMDEIRLSNSARTATEIQNYYNQ